MTKRHQLLSGDYQQREQFCQWLINQLDQFLDDVIIGDEASFALNTSVNARNIRSYSSRGEQPFSFKYQRNDDRHKVNVRVGLMGNGNIIGPSFFQQKIDSENYLQMIY